MKRAARWGLYGLIIAIMTFSIIAIIKESAEKKEAIKCLTLQGEYSINDGKWQMLTAETQLRLKDYGTVKLRGHLSEEVGQGEMLMFKLNNLLCNLQVDGTTIYESHLEQNQNVIQSFGEKWIIIAVPQISESDLIEVELQSIYKNTNKIQFNDFLKKIYAGSAEGLLQEILVRNRMGLFVSIMTLTIGMVAYLITIILQIMKSTINESSRYLSKFVFVCGLWFLVKNEVIVLSFHNATILSYLDIMCQYGIIIFGLEYAISLCKDLRKKWLEACHFLALIYVVIVTTIQLMTRVDYQSFMFIGITLNVVFILSILVCILYEGMHTREEEIKRLLLLSISVLIGGIAEAVNYTSGRFPVSYLFSCCFGIFAVAQLSAYILQMKRASEAIAKSYEMENELIQSRISIMLSQIQPHFLYNSLSAIKYLCDKDPKLAGKAVEHFSFFLRGNLDSLKSTARITFQKEMEHVNNYLYLEKLRFGERLTIFYDIQEEHFMIPTLTIQPIVENAVRYGVTMKEEGGSVTIATRKEGEEIIIIIEDDGVGFDINAKTDASRNHIGMENVRNRIRIQSKGDIIFKSIPGVGTYVEIRIPLL